MYTFEILPVLEPHNLVSVHLGTVTGAECLRYKLLDLSCPFRRDHSGEVVFVDGESGPYHEMLDVLINIIWPIVVQGLVVRGVGEGWIARRCYIFPVKPLVLDVR